MTEIHLGKSLGNESVKVFGRFLDSLLGSCERTLVVTCGAEDTRLDYIIEFVVVGRADGVIGIEQGAVIASEVIVTLGERTVQSWI